MRIIGERFVIDDGHGQAAASGGGGAVYRARDRVNGGEVALKMLHGMGAPDGLRFAREAELLAEMGHPAIVRYVAHGVTEDGERYIAMEWLEGETLEQRLASRRLTVVESLTVGLRVSQALAVAHRREVVHRDIKPANLLVPDGDIARLKVIDFGIARHLYQTRLTQTGLLVGTPSYMAPEQARGARDISPRADVFALGCVLYECLTGTPPFVGEHVMGVLAKILFDDAPRLGEVCSGAPPRLEALLARMLAKDPTARPSDGGAVALELEAMLRDIAEAPDALGGEVVAGQLSLRGARVPTTLTGGEQRILSVILAAAVGGDHGEPDVTAAIPSLEDGQLADHLLRQAVAPFGARLERLAVDSIVVTLSSAGAPTDQAAMAARCALAMRAVLPAAPMALVTGRGVMTARTHPIGEVVDRAVRILDEQRLPHSTGGRRAVPIHLDEATAGLLDTRFEVTGDATGLCLKAERDVDFTRTLLGKPTTCVGRERELAMLEGLLEECVEERVARVALVTASAGLGKSRLRYEFLKRLAERPGAVEVLFGRGESLSAGSPFGMLGPAIRRLCGIVDVEDLEVRQRKLRARVGRNLVDPELTRVAEMLGEVAGVPFPDDKSEALRAARRDPTLLGDSMRHAFETWLEAESKAQPLVIVLEDVHWGDLPSVKFVDGALRNLHDHALLVLALARPEVHAVFPALWADRDVQEIRLARLTRKAAERLVREVLGDEVSYETCLRVIDLADGNAFYLEELIRTVSAGQTELPDTVLGMVQARLDALGGESKRVLRAASVFGDCFWLGGVVALVGERASGVASCLEDLVAREMVTRRTIASLPGETEFVFRHALIREAAYAMLTDDDKVLGHRLAGGWLERSAESYGKTRAGEIDTEQYAVPSGIDPTALAEHLALGQEPARAVRWYRRGAEQALGGNDFATAVRRIQAAIKCGADGEMLASLRLIEAEAHAWHGEQQDARVAAGQAVAGLRPGTELWFRAVSEEVAACCRLGDHAAARTLARDASAAVAEGPDALAQQVVCLSRGALSLMFLGRFDTAMDLIHKAEVLVADAGRLDRHVEARLHEVRALRAYFAGDLDGNLANLESALAGYDAAGDTRNACQARGYLGFAYVELGEIARAEELLWQALAVAERMGLKSVELSALHNLGNAVALRGDAALGRELEERAIELGKALGELRKQGGSHRYLAKIALSIGDLSTAEQEALRAIEILQVAPPLLAGSLATLARVQLAQGRAAEALASAGESVALLESLGSIDEGEALVRLVWAEAQHAIGNQAAAVAAIVAAHTRLVERANKIRDEAWRESFLTRVPENARTLALYREWVTH